MPCKRGGRKVRRRTPPSIALDGARRMGRRTPPKEGEEAVVGRWLPRVFAPVDDVNQLWPGAPSQLDLDTFGVSGLP